MGESIEFLEKKWGFEPERPLFISVFDEQSDFATRTIGLPGFPALGACFGRVVTLDSPRALPPGAFSWNATQHHELAHVITLQLSRGRVSRWLTEGASVYEERKVSKTWNRDDERDLVDAIASDEVLTLENINNAFRGPRVMFAYYQGGLMCEWIERDFGFPKLRELVRLYGEGLDDAAAVRRALGIAPKAFDERFLQFAKDYVKDLRVLRRPTKAKMDRLKRALRKTPDDADGWFLVCEGALARRDTAGALSALANAAKLAPDDGRVPAMRAMVAWRERKPAQAAAHAEEAIAKGVDFYELRVGLAEHYARGEKDMAKAKEHWRKAIEHFPMEKGGDDPRIALSQALAAEGEQNLAEVTALLRAHVDVDEDDVAVRRQLAGIYAQHEKPDDELLMLEQLRDLVPLPNGAMPGPPAPGGAPHQALWDRESAIWLHERLGEIYLARKRYEDAELAWSCAVGVARMNLGAKGEPPAESDVVANLLAHHAESLQLVGRIDEARSRAQEALRLDAENELAKRVLEALGS
jgi:tetratricopeptide (TPR) repeat protein